MQERVSILLATYNGSEFLREQLESLDSQTFAADRIAIRDDGSTDSTLSILEKWAVEQPNVSLLRGTRVGVTKNFFALLASPDEHSDYFAFCDQDDVWLPDKVENAIAALREHGSQVPLMYCSRLELVDEKLRHLGYSRIPKRVGFANALVENVATGCTTVLNRAARTLVCSAPPQRAIFHDWWCYLVISAFGRVIFDERPGAKYRQHSSNQVGAAPSSAELFRRRLSRFVRVGRQARHLSDQAADFKQLFGGFLNAADKETLEKFLSVRGRFSERVSYSAAMDVRRQSWTDTMILRALILAGRV